MKQATLDLIKNIDENTFIPPSTKNELFELFQLDTVADLRKVSRNFMKLYEILEHLDDQTSSATTEKAGIVKFGTEAGNAINSETERIINAISKKNYSYNILLDLNGKMLSSEEMADKIEKISMTNSEINFIIGGSNGVNDKLRKIVDFRLCFSPMTFPHQLMRLILTEQIYRWISINNNIKYHK